MKIAEVQQVHETPGLIVFMLLSNLVGLLVVAKSYYFATRNPRYRLFFLLYGTVILASVIVSFFYHLCQSASACVGLDFYRWRLCDHVTATSGISITFLLLTAIDNSLWVGFVTPLYLGFTMFTVFVFPFDMRSSAVVGVTGLFLILIARILVLRGAPFGRIIGRHRYVSQISWAYLITAGALTVVAVLLFAVIDSDEAYPRTHPPWHILIYLALFAVFMGLTRHMRGWRSPLHLVKCTPDAGKVQWEEEKDEKDEAAPSAPPESILSSAARSFLALLEDSA